METQIENNIYQMSIEDKIRILNGQNFWESKGYEQYGIKKIVFCDGPSGLRFQKDPDNILGLSKSEKAVCFPTSSAIASSWNEELVYIMASSIAKEAIAKGVDVVLGPGVNIKRSPLCGRNFEYYSEDPFLSSQMGAAFVRGLQQNGIGACLKHFVANNQEAYRMSIDTRIDERALNEIYLKAFENIVKNYKPWSVMSGYNKLNGKHCSENKSLLIDKLRLEWKYDGLVVSDWFAVSNILNSIKNGMELEMPSVGDTSYNILMEAYNNNEISDNEINRATINIMNLSRKCDNSVKNQMEKENLEKHHEIARKMAEESMVLLKNENDILPLKIDEKILFIGELGENLSIQGSGSSKVNPTKVDLLDENLANNGMAFNYKKGYELGDCEIDKVLVEDCLKDIKKYEKIVIFTGLFDGDEGEGYDRTDISLPESQNHLIKEIVKLNQNVVVVLQTGSVVEMPWIKNVKAVLQANLCGQGMGFALARILIGKTNPSGKLTETYPLKLSDTGAYLYRGNSSGVTYNESIFVGYRYYDKKEMNVLFPFGHGLSYSKFIYHDFRVEEENNEYQVYFNVTNKSLMDGKEIVQLYVQLNENAEVQPVKQLKTFKKINIKANETKEVVLKLGIDDFKYYDINQKEWIIATGTNKILVGKSSRDIVYEHSIEIEFRNKKYKKINYNTTLSELQKIPELSSFINEQTNMLVKQLNVPKDLSINIKEIEKSMCYIPLRYIVQISKGAFSYEYLDYFINQLNKMLEDAGVLY